MSIESFVVEAGVMTLLALLYLVIANKPGDNDAGIYHASYFCTLVAITLFLIRVLLVEIPN